MQRSFHAVIMRRSLLFVLTIVAFALAMAATSTAQNLNVTLPMKKGSVKFAVIGDTGTGDKHQQAVAKQLDRVTREVSVRRSSIMMGDNLYGGNAAKDYDKKFELPYKPLLDAGVKFYAALGNHDDPSERFYKPFNMDGERYYTFKPGNERAVLRARQQLHGRQAAGVARQGAGGERIRLEDRVLPPSARIRRARRTARTTHAAQRCSSRCS